jgi:8-oxo-dGTP diphosphatase
VAENPAETAQVEYVVGFAFDTRGRVALIRKNRPAWQAGRLNGIGGHVEPGEAPRDAMTREFQEETGTRLDGWERFAVMAFPGAIIYFYRLRNLHPIRLDGLRSITDEEVCIWDHRGLYSTDVIPNLTWLVPLAAYTADTYEVIHIQAAMAEAIDAPEHVLRPGFQGGETDA